jgi:hypothetical protein
MVSGHVVLADLAATIRPDATPAPATDGRRLFLED